MNNLKKVKASLLALSILALPILTPTQVMANDNLLIVEQNNTSSVGRDAGTIVDIIIVPAPGVEDRLEVLRQADQISSEVMGRPFNREGAVESLERNNPEPRSTITIRTIREANARGSRIDAFLETHFSRSVAFTDVTASGVADTMWHGAGNANRVEISNEFLFTGVNVTIGIGSGGVWSTTGNLVSRTAAWHGGTNNNWFMRHNYSGLVAAGMNLHVRQTVTGRFTWGPEVHQVTASVLRGLL